jgi:hypothetical protein
MPRPGLVVAGAVTVIAALLGLLVGVRWSDGPAPAQPAGANPSGSTSSSDPATPTTVEPAGPTTTNPCPGGLVYLPRSGLCTHGGDPADQNR